ncbi:PepSY domain-containing protein [Paenirhodobacter sp. CAU 1674]|uniref:PepSY domain-containing protein n=1 Tax=Paenirhodobacter sp. CAU 1674 TaxID=3032596 RepID=UPI0023D9C5FF|nr:PepSY domain-containing protein [Paenirhodobacter sp. CAU 1674]MDF2142255.1 PepSY domain-containing protein [Paenirhodobacter sp. CAU 1674]
MKTTIAIFAASLTLGQAAFAEVSTQSIIDDLSGQGFSAIEIETAPAQVKVEARNGTTKIEVVYDRETGEILKQEQTRARVRTGEVLAQGVAMRTRAENFLDDDDMDDDVNDDDMSDDEGDDDHGMGGHDDDHESDDNDDGDDNDDDSGDNDSGDDDGDDD